MLVILRMLFGAALLYELTEGAGRASGATEAGDLTGAFYLAICVGLGILNALVWAPYFGAKVSGPLTGMMTESTYVERTNWVLRALRWLSSHGHRRSALAFCFWEAIRHPGGPTAFLVGLNNSRPGSWLERAFAREVFRFNNTQNCVQAYLALRRHGIDPRPHRCQEVNIVLLSLERPPRPEPQVLAVPRAAKPARLPRNPRIRIFRRADEFSGSEGEPAGELAEQVLQPGTVESGLGAEFNPSPVEPRRTGLACVFGRIMGFLRAH